MYKLERTTALDGYTVVHDDLRFKEEWMVQADLLGFKDTETPTKSFLFYIGENYKSARVYREYYVNEETKQFGEVCGLKIVFSAKKEAEAYAEELNSRIV